MNSTEYAKNALRTEKVITQLNFNKDALYSVLNAAIEMAGIVDTVKKTLVYDKPFDVVAYKAQIFALISTLSDAGLNADAAILTKDNDQWLEMPNLRILHGAIGMFGEAGEIIEAVTLQMDGTNDTLDLVNVSEETADSDWYKNIIHDETGVTEEQARAKNIAKLKVRYGDKFTEEAALNRDLVAERAVLEA